MDEAFDKWFEETYARFTNYYQNLDHKAQCRAAWDAAQQAIQQPHDAAIIAAERERCEFHVRYYLLYDSQRAVSWYEVQDCLTAIREGRACPKKS
jgi:hypothetical protein